MAALWALVFSLVGAGCARRPPVPVAVLPDTEAERLLLTVAELGTRYRSLNGLARVRGEIGGQSFSATQGILAASPDKLRLETLSPFGQPLVSVATDGETVEALVPGRKEFWRGDVGSGRIYEALRLPMPFRDMVGLLLCRVPVQPFSDRQLVLDSTGRYRLALASRDGRRQILFFDVLSRLTGSDWYNGDELRVRVEFDDFRAEDGFPRGFFWKIPYRNQEVHVLFSEIAVNPDIPSDRFRISPPPGVDIHPFPETGGTGPFEVGG